MKSGSIFWGALFISVGTLLILMNLDALFFDMSHLWDWWPILIILWGISILKLSEGIKKLLSGISGILVAVVLVSMFSYVFGFVDDSDWYSDRCCDGKSTSRFEDADWKTLKKIEYNSIVKTALLDIKAGAGDFRIKNNSDDLISISGCGVLTDQMENGDSSGSRAEIFYKANLFKDIFNSDFERDVDIKINKNPVWDINVSVGAAAFIADLRDFKIRDLDFKIGAAGVELILGDLYDSTNVSIKSGASGVEISIPKSSGCEVFTNTGITSGVDLPRFDELSNNHYRTSNFDTARKKIFINISGGAAGFEIRRY